MSDLERVAQLGEQLRQAEKMEALGRLVGGVAHDFNNLLLAIHGYAELALASLPDEADARDDVEQIARVAERGTRLTRQLLAFSRKEPQKTEVVDVNVAVADAEALLRRLMGADVELVSVRAPAAAYVRADRGQLAQIVVNLGVNARDAMPRGGSVTIEVSTVERSGEAPQALIRVSDTGEGMDAETATHVFQPFFTTKEAGHGTGLGLATVHAIVTQSGGRVDLATSLGRGSTFDVYLPLTDPPSPSQQQDEFVEPEAAAARILVVEDDAAVREIVARVLRSGGFAVVTAANGDEAQLAAEAGEFDLLLADVVLPGASGGRVAAALTERHPRMRVIFMSGHGDDVVRRGLPSGECDFLQKPFSGEALLAKVRDALGARGAADTPAT